MAELSNAFHPNKHFEKTSKSVFSIPSYCESKTDEMLEEMAEALNHYPGDQIFIS